MNKGDHVNSQLNPNDAATLAQSEGRHPRATAVTPEPTQSDSSKELLDPMEPGITFTEMARRNAARYTA